ncbi:MAG: hypothetical protein ACRDDX_15945 [Cellulosilyticaceae bacterium]
MESKAIEFSMYTVWECLLQLVAIGMVVAIIAVIIMVLVLLTRKLKKNR